MYDLLIKNGKLVNGGLVDVAILNEKIARVESDINDAAIRTVDLKGLHFLSAGWIDSHTHCYPSSPIYNDEPDLIGVTHGVTTVVDAGSVGADDVDDFYRLTQQSATNVYSILNISRIGLLRQDELADMSDISLDAAKTAITKHSDFVVGIKARMSGSVVKNNGLAPLIRAKEMQAQNNNLPLMVHVGNNPPNLDDIAELLTKGDIITHCYNGKPNRILTPEGELKESMKKAIKRGVILDVGHGGASFSFDVAEQAIKKGIYPDTISSDIYCKNRISGPVRSLSHIMSKFLSIGLPMDRVIDCVTINAANALKMKTKGTLEIGQDADITIFNIHHEACTFEDSEQGTRQGEESFLPLASIVAGKLITTQHGEQTNVFNS
ncbi:amidohydrolase/deacetylase family metallohydrolase [Aliivibrio sp. SR45-2]|jgi:dihydroorotase|uniref:amidohydrolase/deacetylase family metallohydrolase n=1 Tax=Aliivibrio sp. SR45-2 TaxID=2760931 RepID=UPI0015FDF378|nr:amidohydrolase/deacetylase family metallohydrolase [Aliivibrio sp. SR45-2]MBB1313307.1 amidohydrolase/deacetylase family metallohydrolase [Aliivibrio sp. SR45-2]